MGNALIPNNAHYISYVTGDIDLKFHLRRSKSLCYVGMDTHPAFEDWEKAFYRW